jgi:FlaA1/EpsC-like NDP-sugar epimerase
MKRFFIDINDILKRIEFIFKNAKWWELYIVWWPILSLNSLLDLMISLYWDGSEKVQEIWVRPWEKFDETLISQNEIDDCIEIEKDFFVLGNTERKKKRNVKFSEYSTKTGENFNKEEMKIILRKLWEKM